MWKEENCVQWKGYHRVERERDGEKPMTHWCWIKENFQHFPSLNYEQTQLLVWRQFFLHLWNMKVTLFGAQQT
jgi:hypothetical protein